MSGPQGSPETPFPQGRIVRTLCIGQVFSALGTGSTLALGSILAVDLSGSEAWAGSVNTAMTLGTAVTAMPLAGLAVARGRRWALAGGLAAAILGTTLMVAAVMTRLFPVLLAGAFLVGLAFAANLQARFAVTDMARPDRRGRDLSLVVWAITIGAVTGPNMVGPGAVLGEALGIPAQAGPFLISAVGMLIGATIVWTFLRPDPLLARLAHSPQAATTAPRRRATGAWLHGWSIVRHRPKALAAVVSVVAAHAVMVAVMSITPLHMQHHAGASAGSPDTIALIGFTISLHIAGMYAASPIMGWSADRLGPAKVVLLGLLTLLAAVLLTGFGAANMTMVTVGLVLLGLGWSAATIAGATLLVSSLEPDQAVPAQGFSDATMSLAGALGSALAGPAMGWADYSGISAVVGVVVVAAGIWVGRVGLEPTTKGL
ncbi:MFS transporter [Kocuria soli]|uniref:MFS transporter n=1 Tax=Kocuria soli TaxID=2485125 RepID=A0A3N3ZNS2_9MICC|nr:MFS transporter [Kocuria soli]